jgi:hypothetical protein
LVLCENITTNLYQFLQQHTLCIYSLTDKTVFIILFFPNLIQSWRLLSMFKKVMPYLQQTLQCNAAGVVKSWMIGGGWETQQRAYPGQNLSQHSPVRWSQNTSCCEPCSHSSCKVTISPMSFHQSMHSISTPTKNIFFFETAYIYIYMPWKDIEEWRYILTHS